MQKSIVGALALFMLAGSASAQLVIGRDGTNAEVLLIDVGGAQAVRTLAGGSSTTFSAWGAAADEDNGFLYWNNGGTLFRGQYSPSGTLVTTQVTMSLNGGAVNFTGLAYDSLDDKLYGYRNVTVPGLYEIDPVSGVATLVFATTSTDFGGFDYDRATDAFYGLNDTAAGLSGTGIYRIDKPLSAPTFTRLSAYPSTDNDIDGLAVGGGKAYLVQDTPAQGIHVFNLTTNSYEADLVNPFSGSGTFSAGAWAPGLLVLPQFDARLDMAGPAACSVQVGGSAVFLATAINGGQQPLTGVTLSFPIPSGSSFVSSSPSGSVSGGILTVNLGTVAPGAQSPVSVTLTAGEGGLLQATASVSVTETDEFPNNNSAAASTFVVGSPPATAAVKGVLSSIAGQPNSEVPGRPGTFFTTTGFDRPFRSPDGTRFVVTADTDAATTADMVLLVGHNGVVSLGIAEGDVTPEGDGVGIIEGAYGINNAGHYVFSFNSTLGGSTNDEVIVKFDGTTFAAVVREGNSNPALSLNYGTLNSGAQIQADGSVSFHTSLVGATSTTDTAIFRNSGNTLIAQEGVTIPTNQIDGGTFTVRLMDTGNTDGQGLFTNADGSRHIWSGFTNDVIAQDRVAVVDGAVVIQEGSVITGSGFPSTVSIINYVGMESNGDWFAYGSNLDANDWAIRNGVVVGATDAPIHTGATELWDDAPYAQTFFLTIGNNNGDYVVGGTTNNSTGITNAVLVLNGTSVLMRENDPVDLNNDGIFNDGVYVRTFRDDYAFMTDTELWISIRLRDEPNAQGCATNDPDIGSALVKIALPPTGPVCGTSDFDGDGDVGTDADIEAFFACLAGNCCATCFAGGADFNGDGDTGTDADIEAFFRVLAGGEC
jgi:hypothetical protein